MKWTGVYSSSTEAFLNRRPRYIIPRIRKPCNGMENIHRFTELRSCSHMIQIGDQMLQQLLPAEGFEDEYDTLVQRLQMRGEIRRKKNQLDVG